MADYKDIKYDFSGVNLTALNATQLTSGTTPDARYGTLPAVSGVNLTLLNATNLGSGTVPTARLGTGTASSSTFLAGDNTWGAAGGGKVNQVLQTVETSDSDTDSTSFSTLMTRVITPTATDSKILVMCSANLGTSGGNIYCITKLSRGADAAIQNISDRTGWSSSGATYKNHDSTSSWWLDSPSTTSEVSYTFQFRTSYAYSDVYFNNSSGTTGNTSTLTVMEILA